MPLFGNRSFLVKMVKDTPSGPVEEDVFDDIKSHFEKYKAAYIVGGISVGIFSVAGITYLIMRGQASGIQGVPGLGIRGVPEVEVRPLAFLSKQTVNAVAVIEKGSRGHPGYPVWCDELQKGWATQGEAAKELGVYPSLISGHLNGKFPDVDGKHLHRIKV